MQIGSTSTLRVSDRSGQPTAETDKLAALTTRECAVVTVIVDGATNREAAIGWYVSVKAVEYHLGNVYAKRADNSRRQLKALVGTP